MRLTKRNIKALRRVQRIIMNPPEGEGFNMSVFNSTRDKGLPSNLPDKSPLQQECNTVRCIAGWLAHLDNRYEVFISNPGGVGIWGNLIFAHDQEKTQDGFGIQPWTQLTAEQASRAIDQFIATNGKHAWKGIA